MQESAKKNKNSLFLRSNIVIILMKLNFKTAYKKGSIMKYAINMQAIKALSIAALLIMTSQTVYSVTVVGKDVPALQEAVKKLHELSGTSRYELIKMNIPNTKYSYIYMPNKDLRGVTALRLSRSNLEGSNLTGASLPDLSLANLANTNLTNATLKGASSADFTNANLTNAHLTDGFLAFSNFTNANLTNADLTGATLINVNLTGASLRGANFSGAKHLSAEQKAYARSQGAINVPD